MVRLTDPQFKKNWRYYLLQSLAGAIMVTLLLTMTAIIDSHVVLAALGASIFIAVAFPHAKSSHARYFIGGYLCGIVSGVIGIVVYFVIPGISEHIAAGIAVGICILLMVALEAEHPPAAGLTLGFVLSPYNLDAMIIALCCVGVISVLLHFCRPYMKDLL